LSMSVSEMDRYLFDCQGYVVLPQVLDAAMVDELRRLLEETGWWDTSVPGQTSHQGDILSLGRPFWDLMDHPRIEPYLSEWLGPGFRLDHVYPIFKSTGGEPQQLHHGGEPFSPNGYYHVQNGTISCGLTVVTFALTDCGPGDGGFACVPGSHKSAFRTPDQIVDWTDRSHTATIPMRAGDALIFTEAMCHGSAPWTAAHPRISLLYKFSPGNSAWGAFDDGWPADVVENCTQRQREILEPPYVRSAKGNRRRS
jgi:ectoine hydroxylase-related dioxygenase (phytanoyl-CoA dioxygenase family)